jgi:hypothetical protein
VRPSSTEKPSPTRQIDRPGPTVAVRARFEDENDDPKDKKTTKVKICKEQARKVKNIKDNDATTL